MTDQNSQLKERIEQWFDDEGIPFQGVPDINSRFLIRAQMKNMQINVRESNVRIGCIVIEGIMSLNEDQTALLKKLKNDEAQRHALFLKFFRQLDQEEYLFQLSRNFFEPNWLRIQRILYREDLSRSSLLNGMKELNMRFVRMNYELNEVLDNLTEPPMDGSLYR